MTTAAAIVLWATPSSAHRLDEYLQATRLAVAADRVNVEIDLTPGANIAEQVLGWIDTDRNGAIDGGEGDRYARDVMRDVRLTVDGEPTTLTLSSVAFPAADGMRAGTGSIQVRAVAHLTTASGRHHLSFVNGHRPDSSVYLANMLVPSDARISVGSPQRDRAQRQLSVDYDMAGTARRTAWLLAGFAVVGVLIAGRRRRL